ncbi:MAG: reverse transcriptase/maturase family protein [bacterium]
MGNVSIDLSLNNIIRSWWAFRRGKKPSLEIDRFEFRLIENLSALHSDLNSGTYCHGGYRQYIVNENKKRLVSVASIRDRVVHRLLYDFLVKIHDPVFIFDIWSCRVGKGLLGAIERAQLFLKQSPRGYVWRADIRHFFDSVNHSVLMKLIKRRVSDPRAVSLLENIIESYSFPERERVNWSSKKGIPIGNLTSQIFANIYLNELDWHAKHILRVNKYLRYGDDFILIAEDINEVECLRRIVIGFVESELLVNINPKNDIIVRSNRGIHFLGVKIFPNGRILNDRNWRRVSERLEAKNVSSYRELVRRHGGLGDLKIFDFNLILSEFV